MTDDLFAFEKKVLFSSQPFSIVYCFFFFAPQNRKNVTMTGCVQKEGIFLCEIRSEKKGHRHQRKLHSVIFCVPVDRLPAWCKKCYLPNALISSWRSRKFSPLSQRNRILHACQRQNKAIWKCQLLRGSWFLFGSFVW